MTPVAPKARPPLAELHCHIEGAARPALAREQARRLGVDLSGLVDDDRYLWDGFSGFLAAYDRIAALFRSEEDYARLAEDHLAGLAGEGAIYAEIFVSPDHASATGLAPEAYLAGLDAGIDRAREAHGIEARMIVVGVRHFGPERVEAAARFAAKAQLRHPRLTGFGMAGDERQGDVADVARAFDIARAAGLGLTVHAGEFGGAEAVRRTIDLLKPARIGHGVRASEDPALMARIAADGIVLEICPASNIALGVYSEERAHPLRRLVEAGIRVTLNSDDPPFFATTLSDEYAFAARARFTPGECLGFTRNAIEAAFVDAATRRQLFDRLMGAAFALGAPGADS